MVIVGAGKAGRRHAIAARAIPEISLIGVYDSSPNAGQQFAAEFNIQNFPCLESALSCRTPCFVSICTPPSTHSALAKSSIDAGCHALVEKPFDINLDTIDELEQMALRRGLHLGAVAQHRFAGDVIKLHDRVRSGALGSVFSSDIRIRRYRAPAYFSAQNNNWRVQSAMAGGGVLLTIGFHYIDLACWMLGEPSNARAVVKRYIGDIETSISCVCKIGETATTIDASWGEIEGHSDRMSLSASGKNFELIGDRIGSNMQHFASPLPSLHERQIRDFVQAILKDRSPRVTPADVKPALSLILDLYRSTVMNV